MDVKKTRSKKLVDEILNYEERPYSLREQKTELLWRNRKFQEDLGRERIHFEFVRKAREQWNSLARKAWSKPKEETTDRELRLALRLQQAITKVRPFHEKWDLGRSSREKIPYLPGPHGNGKGLLLGGPWDGRKETLECFIEVGAGLWQFDALDPRQNLMPLSKLPAEFTRFENALPRFKPVAFITIDPWTTREEIVRDTRALPIIKKRLFGFSFDSRQRFAQHLCWYDLHEVCGLDARQIARIWAAKRPAEFRKMLEKVKDWKSAREEARPAIADAYLEFRDGLPQTIYLAIERLKKAISYLDPKTP